MSVGQRLKSLRLSSGMSLRAVAEIIGVQHGSVSKWENETNNIKRHHLQALSDISMFLSNGLFLERMSVKVRKRF